MATVDFNKVMTNSVIDLIRHYPFYGHIMTQLGRVMVNGKDASVPTMGVGKTSASDLLPKLFINTDYLQTLFDSNTVDAVFDHIQEVLKHEIHHLIFQHLTLNFSDRNREVVACECSVNSYVNRTRLIASPGEKQAGVFAEDFKLPTRESVHFYYNALEDNPEYKKNRQDKYEMSLSSGQNESGQSGEGDNGESDGKSKDKNGSGKDQQGGSKDKDQPGSGGKGKMVDSHEMWKAVAEDPMAEEMIKDIIRQAAEICKKTNKWGDVPGDIQAAVNAAFMHNKPAIPWQTILRNFIASSSENVLDYTMKRRSKRFGTRPGTKKEDVLELAIGIDTSGSVSDDMIGLFFNELHWISKTNSKITIFEIDTEIQREYPFSQWTGKEVSGRGGTDLEPLLEEVCNRHFDALIFFTDMGTPRFKCQNYPIDTMWVINSGEYNSIDEMPYQRGVFLKLSDSGDSFEVIS